MEMLITGGAGFIGVNAARYFADRGWRVTVFDNLSRRATEENISFLQESFPESVAIVRGDVRSDRDVLVTLAEQHDVVLHLAAQVAVTSSVAAPLDDFETNALGTMNVLEAIRFSARRPALLYASTNKVYGALEHLPLVEQETRYAFADDQNGISESCLLDFHSPYGCSKGSADQYVRDYARIYGLKTVVFRQSCIYGPRNFGIEDQGWVAWFLIRALMGQPITIFGDGKQVRDLLFVDDLLDLYSRAIEQIDRASGQAFNVGGGAENALSLLEFSELLKAKFSLPMKVTFSAWRPGDQKIFVSDNAKAGRLLGWKPMVSVEQGIERVLGWLGENRAIIDAVYMSNE
jgi:CDP-paratose 2-epimerase